MCKKIGVMGCGVVAGYGHLPALMRTEGLSVHALFDPSVSRHKAMGQTFNVPHTTDSLDAFFDTGIDAVLIASSAPAHAENVYACAARGLPVLCEKPLAMNDPEGEAMIAAMIAAKAPLHVAFCYRFSAAALEIKRLVAGGAIGDVAALRLIYNWDCHGRFNHRDPSAGLASYRDGRMREGGPMVDCGTHQIDLAHWWLDSPAIAWTGHGAFMDGGYESPDHVWAHLTHANGAHTAVEMSYGYGHTARDADSSFKYELIGSRGVIVYDRNPGRFELRNSDGTTHMPHHEEKDFDAMHQAWAHALITGDSGHLATAADGLNATRIAVEVTRQASAGSSPNSGSG
ncbi:MAG: Gfo/Idh/MocA family oxidoreductase [Algisphaera sp.]